MTRHPPHPLIPQRMGPPNWPSVPAHFLLLHNPWPAPSQADAEIHVCAHVARCGHSLPRALPAPLCVNPCPNQGRADASLAKLTGNQGTSGSEGTPWQGPGVSQDEPHRPPAPLSQLYLVPLPSPSLSPLPSPCCVVTAWSSGPRKRSRKESGLGSSSRKFLLAHSLMTPTRRTILGGDGGVSQRAALSPEPSVGPGWGGGSHGDRGCPC